LKVVEYYSIGEKVRESNRGFLSDYSISTGEIPW
jgi:hypothetical protein